MDLPNYDFSLLPVRVNNRVYSNAKIRHFMHEIMHYSKMHFVNLFALWDKRASFLAIAISSLLMKERNLESHQICYLGPQCAQTHRSQDAHKILVQSVK